MADKKSCRTEHHLTVAEYGLWDVYRKLSFASGRMFEEPGRTAERFSGASRSKIVRLRKSLIEKGWLMQTKKSVHNNKNAQGRRTPAEYRVLSHEEWSSMNPKQCSKTVNDILDDLAQPVSETSVISGTGGNQPVSPVNSASVTRGIRPVSPVARSIEVTSLKVKRESQGSSGLSSFKEKNETERNHKVKPKGAPMSPVALAPMSPVALEAHDPYSQALAYDPTEHVGDRWMSRQGIGRGLMRGESVERDRRNCGHLTPTDVLNELTREAGVQ